MLERRQKLNENEYKKKKKNLGYLRIGEQRFLGSFRFSVLKYNRLLLYMQYLYYRLSNTLRLGTRESARSGACAAREYARTRSVASNPTFPARAVLPPPEFLLGFPVNAATPGGGWVHPCRTLDTDRWRKRIFFDFGATGDV